MLRIGKTIVCRVNAATHAVVQSDITVVAFLSIVHAQKTQIQTHITAPTTQKTQQLVGLTSYSPPALNLADERDSGHTKQTAHRASAALRRQRCYRIITDAPSYQSINQSDQSEFPK